MIEFYSKQNCPNCVKIKNQLSDLGLRFNYYDDESSLMNKVTELKNNGKLIEMIAPLVIKDGIQIKHKNIKNLKGE